MIFKFWFIFSKTQNLGFFDFKFFEELKSPIIIIFKIALVQ